jgi:hypothetical protein
MSALERKAEVAAGSASGTGLGEVSASTTIARVVSPAPYFGAAAASAPTRANLAIDGGGTAQ